VTGFSRRVSNCSMMRNGVGAMPRAHARVHTLGQYFHVQLTDEIPAQRSGAPQLIIVAALGIETDDERRISKRVAECLQVRGQMHAAAFLRCLDENYAARQRKPSAP